MQTSSPWGHDSTVVADEQSPDKFCVWPFMDETPFMSVTARRSFDCAALLLRFVKTKTATHGECLVSVSASEMKHRVVGLCVLVVHGRKHFYEAHGIIFLAPPPNDRYTRQGQELTFRL